MPDRVGQIHEYQRGGGGTWAPLDAYLSTRRAGAATGVRALRKAADRPPLPRLHPLLRILRRRQWPRRWRRASGMDLPGRQVAPAATPGVKRCLLVVARGRIFLRLEEREILAVSLLLQLLDGDESQGRG